MIIPVTIIAQTAACSMDNDNELELINQNGNMISNYLREKNTVVNTLTVVYS